MSNSLRISLFQTDLVWEDKEANLNQIAQAARSLSGVSDLLVLPEMVTTGFSMAPERLAETNDGPTVTQLRTLARECNLALTGSFIACDEEGAHFNRGFFITPDEVYFADKRHLFRMGEEPNHYRAGTQRTIIPYKGFNILLLVCYDLRFPAWSRCRNNEYDLLLYVANWPSARRQVWNTLLAARAIENSCFVCGVNRVGTDGLGLTYLGDSQIITPRGTPKLTSTEGEASLSTTTLSKEELDDFRRKFPTWMDGDSFTIEGM